MKDMEKDQLTSRVEPLSTSNTETSKTSIYIEGPSNSAHLLAHS